MYVERTCVTYKDDMCYARRNQVISPSAVVWLG